MNTTELKSFLDEKVNLYNRPDFISSDPISIPHLFQKKEDIEIIAFLVATIAWGKREMIIKNGLKLCELLEHEPYNFVIHHSKTDLKNLGSFVHRTFNETDLKVFLSALKHLYQNHGGLEKSFSNGDNVSEKISRFKALFFSIPHAERTEKHVSDPLKGSSAKRLNMFLRWMVRKDNNGVDFGIWNTIKPSELYCPLDVHTGNTARKLQLLKRKQNDWKAVVELTEQLRKFDPNDPIKYDFALFGIGVFEDFLYL